MSDSSSRPEFRAWIDKQPQPNRQLLPLTHITKGLLAGDIVREGRISPTKADEVSGEHSCFFFYGRPAYRVHGDGAIKVAATCPFMFIFDPKVIEQADNIHAFDTGAFGRRMYSHVLMDEMDVEDFSLETNSERPNKLISTIYKSSRAYFDADIRETHSLDDITDPDDFLARAYIQLIASNGRNEADDRVGTIEITVKQPVSLQGLLLAVAIPDILWNDKYKSSWISDLSESGVEILPFPFLPGRSSEYYMNCMEVEARKYYEVIGAI